MTLTLKALPGGWHELVTYSAGGGTRYGFGLPDGIRCLILLRDSSQKMCMANHFAF